MSRKRDWGDMSAEALVRGTRKGRAPADNEDGKWGRQTSLRSRLVHDTVTAFPAPDRLSHLDLVLSRTVWFDERGRKKGDGARRKEVARQREEEGGDDKSVCGLEHLSLRLGARLGK
jgi:hypothetical protein